jgi:hypothetical protein
MASYRRALSSVQPTEGKRSRSTTPDGFGPPSTHAGNGSPMTVRGGGVPSSTMALMPFFRMGPPPRSSRCRCASLHHGLGRAPTEYKDVARNFVHHTRAPLDFVIPTRPSVPPCSEPSRPSLRWGPAQEGADPSLDRSCARRQGEVWVGTKKRALSGRTKNIPIPSIQVGRAVLRRPETAEPGGVVDDVAHGARGQHHQLLDCA